MPSAQPAALNESESAGNLHRIHAPAPEAESAWLLLTLARLFGASVYLCLCVGVGLGWPLDKVGNGLQLLGIGIASLGVPVVPPFLSQIERDAALAARRARKRLVVIRSRLRDVWARLTGRRKVVCASVTLTAAGELSVAGGMDVRVRVDRAWVSDRAWLEHLDDQVHHILDRLDARDRVRREEHEALDRRFDRLRGDLQTHTLTVTRQGWRFILGGAACSAAGTVLALLA